MLWSVLTTSPSRPTRTLTAYSSAPRRTSSASASASLMIRRLSASACWVRPRSSIRKAACSWALATIRSASSCAFSMIRSPSELIRFAARTSSGTATRSSSIRPRAACWSTTTLFVRGRCRPLAMIDSRRSTRKMMSIGVPSGGGSIGSDAGTAGRRRGLSHGRRAVAPRLTRSRPSSGSGDRRSPGRAAPRRRRSRSSSARRGRRPSVGMPRPGRPAPRHPTRGGAGSHGCSG